MLRVQLVRLQPAVHCVVMQLPHIISDVWTEHILAEDLSELYSAFQQSRTLRCLSLMFAMWTMQSGIKERLILRSCRRKRIIGWSMFSNGSTPLDLKGPALWRKANCRSSVLQSAKGAHDPVEAACR